MLKILITTSACALCLGSVSAFAQEPKTPPAIPASTLTWTGCYIGGHLGYGFGEVGFSDQYLTPQGLYPASSPKAEVGGGVLGGQIGCDYQFANHIVVGAEGSASWANVRGSSDPFFGGKAVFNNDTQWLASGAGRVGYAIDRWLVYGKGGVAWAGDKYKTSATFAGTPFSYVGTDVRPGWTLGTGAEWNFWKNWTLSLEYNYYNFGDRSIALNNTGEVYPSTEQARIKQDIHTVTLGVNWRF